MKSIGGEQKLAKPNSVNSAVVVHVTLDNNKEQPTFFKKNNDPSNIAL